MRLAYLFYCALPVLAPAQVNFLPGHQHLRGTVGPYAVTMDVDGGPGYYSYDRIGQLIRLEQNEAGALCEKFDDSEQKAGCVTGSQAADGTFRGVFQSTRSYPVLLRPAPADSPMPVSISIFNDSRRLADGRKQTVQFGRLSIQAKTQRLQALLDRDYLQSLFSRADPPLQPLQAAERQARDDFWSEAGEQSGDWWSWRTVAWNAHGWLSVAESLYRNTGSGTRGLIALGYRTYDIVEGRVLTLPELIRPGTEKQFDTAFDNTVRRTLGYKAGEELPVQYNPGVDFLMTPKGLLFGVDDQPAQAAGHLDFFVPFTELEHILRPETKRFRR